VGAFLADFFIAQFYVYVKFVSWCCFWNKPDKWFCFSV